MSSTLEMAAVNCIFCLVSTDELIDPRKFPCGHIACLGCLQRGSLPESHDCPRCREWLSKASPKDLPEYVHISRPVPKPLSSNCSAESCSATSEMYCRDCESQFCEKHEQMHKVLHFNHDTVDWKYQDDTKNLLCDKHDSNKIKEVCGICYQSFCGRCDASTRCKGVGDHSKTPLRLVQMKCDNECKKVKQYISSEQKYLNAALKALWYQYDSVDDSYTVMQQRLDKQHTDNKEEEEDIEKFRTMIREASKSLEATVKKYTSMVESRLDEISYLSTQAMYLRSDATISQKLHKVGEIDKQYEAVTEKGELDIHELECELELIDQDGGLGFLIKRRGEPTEPVIDVLTTDIVATDVDAADDVTDNSVDSIENDPLTTQQTMQDSAIDNSNSLLIEAPNTSSLLGGLLGALLIGRCGPSMTAAALSEISALPKAGRDTIQPIIMMVELLQQNQPTESADSAGAYLDLLNKLRSGVSKNENEVTSGGVSGFVDTLKYLLRCSNNYERAHTKQLSTSKPSTLHKRGRAKRNRSECRLPQQGGKSGYSIRNRIITIRKRKSVSASVDLLRKRKYNKLSKVSSAQTRVTYGSESEVGTQTGSAYEQKCSATQTGEQRLWSNSQATQTEPETVQDVSHNHRQNETVDDREPPVVRLCSDAAQDMNIDTRSEVGEEDGSSRSSRSSMSTQTNRSDSTRDGGDVAADDWAPLPRRHEARSEDGGSDRTILSLSSAHHPESENSSDDDTDIG